MNSNYDYTRSVEAENEKLRTMLEQAEIRNDALVEECSVLTSRYDKGEVKLVSILLGSKKTGYITLPLFSHPTHRECVKFINTHYGAYWIFPDTRKKLCNMLRIKRVTIMYQITFICGAKNKKKGGRDWYNGFSLLENNQEAMYYDPRKKAFNITFKPS